MESSETEIARRALQTALERLNRQAADEGHRGDTLPGGGPVIVIMLGQVSGPTELQGGNVDERVAGKPGTTPGGGNSTAAHPGLEKFVLNEGRDKDSAPKACFMEPERACVNSGACEMRGH
jgi:hypothetical protein